MVVLDEAGMTEDAMLLRLLVEADMAGSKVVLVRDDRQLSAVEPGGGLGALLSRHRDAVHVLDENVLQTDGAEREALVELRSGDVSAAVRWHAAQDRIVSVGWRRSVRTGQQQ